MVFILKKGVSINEVAQFRNQWESKGFSTIWAPGTDHDAICLIGNTSTVDMDVVVNTNPIVEYARRVTEQFKAASRTVHEDDTIVKVGNIKIGGGGFTVIAGPCSIESQEQISKIAASVKESGAKILRGGAFKPRSSPYAFQGLGVEGLTLLQKAKENCNIPVITEIMNQTQTALFENVDIVQIGARNMQNYDLLKEVGKMGKPVLLKRGPSSSIDELLMSAEYIMNAGCSDIILCERGIRTFETSTRNTLDISAICVLKQKTHLPVIIDPSHACGIRSYVPALSKAAFAVGADGLLVEVHNDPSNALCDGAQSLNLKQFDDLMIDLKKYANLENKDI